MADSELEEIRKARLAELQQQAGRSEGPSQEEQRQQQEGTYAIDSNLLRSSEWCHLNTFSLRANTDSV